MLGVNSFICEVAAYSTNCQRDAMHVVAVAGDPPESATIQ